MKVDSANVFRFTDNIHEGLLGLEWNGNYLIPKIFQFRGGLHTNIRQYILRSQSLAWAGAKFSGSLRWVLFTFSVVQAGA
jgi:hypothetical protein